MTNCNGCGDPKAVYTDERSANEMYCVPCYVILNRARHPDIPWRPIAKVFNEVVIDGPSVVRGDQYHCPDCDWDVPLTEAHWHKLEHEEHPYGEVDIVPGKKGSRPCIGGHGLEVEWAVMYFKESGYDELRAGWSYLTKKQIDNALWFHKHYGPHPWKGRKKYPDHMYEPVDGTL